MNQLDEPLLFDMNNGEHQEVKDFFQRCGLLQYLHIFISEGFESLSALYEITEEDMVAMGVKRGHRRLIQRDIANARNLPPPDSIGAPPFKTSMTFYNPSPSAPRDSFSSATNTPPSSADVSGNADSNSTGSGSSSSGGNGSASSKRASDVIIQHQTKRKYRRRPKPDKNAPVKPPSAYIMFSNEVRAEMKDQNMSFAEIARSIGEQWKAMSPEKKHSYEITAMQAKDAYLIAMQQHRQTAEYKQYQEYLKGFKEKQAVANRLISRARRRSPSKKTDSPIVV
ncbi:high mobility group box domain-containing protein [Fennellomyces sp. T-0311]|nr:high mobility group box domain-containing protein [Fennellomyces sp. T-0311]